MRHLTPHALQAMAPDSRGRTTSRRSSSCVKAAPHSWAGVFAPPALSGPSGTSLDRLCPCTWHSRIACVITFR